MILLIGIYLAFTTTDSVARWLAVLQVAAGVLMLRQAWRTSSDPAGEKPERPEKPEIPEIPEK